MNTYRSKKDLSPAIFGGTELGRCNDVVNLVEARLRKQGIYATSLYFSYAHGGTERFLVMRERKHVDDDRLQIDLRKISLDNRKVYPHRVIEISYEVHLGGKQAITLHDKELWEERRKKYATCTRFYGCEIEDIERMVIDIVSYLRQGKVVSRFIEALAA